MQDGQFPEHRTRSKPTNLSTIARGFYMTLMEQQDMGCAISLGEQDVAGCGGEWKSFE
jgi:hypothetical protein